jgi:squalene synthase HpnC
MNEQSDAAAKAYRWCRALARTHYENFPVASWLLPRRLRDPVATIYAFARSADDIADEGEHAPQQRLQQLDEMETAVTLIAAGQPPAGPLYTALADSMARHHLAAALLLDLLSAFRQDVLKNRYANFGEVMDYCRRSANPVGRLLLQLAGVTDQRRLALSDAVCSALQLINFLQDIDQDYRENGRIYLPQDEMARFNVTEQTIAERRASAQFSQLMQLQIQRAARLLHAGSPLGRELKGRFGLELRTIILGGSRILDKLRAQNDPFARPRLDRADRLRIVAGALKQGFIRA